MEKKKCELLLESDQLLHLHPSKKACMLKLKERKKTSDMLNTVLQLNNAEALCKAVHSRTDAGLDLQCFPDRRAFWHSIKDTADLEDVVKTAACKYMELYRTHGKGRVKYSFLYVTGFITNLRLLIAPMRKPYNYGKHWQVATRVTSVTTLDE